MFTKVQLSTRKNDTVQITDQIVKLIAESHVQEGTCTISVPHTTAGLIITSFWDPRGLEDIQDEVSRLVPTRVNFKHQHDTPSDAAGHVKSAIVGTNQVVIIHEGKPILGGSQGIYFLEFDGPRNREYIVSIGSYGN
ncbi:secondary thiamine-phosphate synthase enzyme YjbQ [Lacticaseibacillus nasuensis]|uniref:secondary thiamine-phosphate synthase enzyme YjbQ n=1 Tax=Lacticaseibacillus nasuensis TaxID=944671 RepID=UPI0022486C6F|nr:secondary thiamine-phosphate synthase enzyme YjbQ [Lacticaseibacillus nasuensis]MCX2456025.1 secondary thiamine-phosphate synthase enzyme YjbQ [Lacticaseibacillus nasuensis]